MHRHAAIAVVATLVAILAITACSSKWQENQDRVRVGMTQAEVEELLGPPSSRVNVPEFAGAPGYVRWQWNDNLSTLATGAMYPDTVPDRVLAVGFDAEGKVNAVSLPSGDWSK